MWRVHMYVFSPNTIKRHVAIVRDSLNIVPVVPSSDVMHTHVAAMWVVWRNSCAGTLGVHTLAHMNTHLHVRMHTLQLHTHTPRETHRLSHIGTTRHVHTHQLTNHHACSCASVCAITRFVAWPLYISAAPVRMIIMACNCSGNWRWPSSHVYLSLCTLSTLDSTPLFQNSGKDTGLTAQIDNAICVARSNSKFEIYKTHYIIRNYIISCTYKD